MPAGVHSTGRTGRRHDHGESSRRLSRMAQSAVPSTRAGSSMAPTAHRVRSESSRVLCSIPKHGKGDTRDCRKLGRRPGETVNHQTSDSGARLPMDRSNGQARRCPSIRPAHWLRRPNRKVRYVNHAARRADHGGEAGINPERGCHSGPLPHPSRRGPLSPPGARWSGRRRRCLRRVQVGPDLSDRGPLPAANPG
jgi:hypothetical protein